MEKLQNKIDESLEIYRNIFNQTSDLMLVERMHEIEILSGLKSQLNSLLERRIENALDKYKDENGVDFKRKTCSV